MEWTVQGIAAGVREDGRGGAAVRGTRVETGVLASCVGSGRATRTDSLCHAVAAVKTELSAKSDVLVRLSVCASFASALLHDDRRLRELEGDLSRCLEAALGGDVIDRKKLVVVPGAEGLAWTIYVDLVSFGPTDACLLDLCSWAVRAALARTKIPKITPVRSALLNKPDFTVEGDLDDAIPLDVSQVPVFVTVALFGTIVVLDPSQAEIAFADAHIVAAISLAGQISFSRVHAKLGLAPTVLFSMLNAAKEAAAASIRSMEEQLKEEDALQKPKTWLVLN